MVYHHELLLMANRTTGIIAAQNASLLNQVSRCHHRSKGNSGLGSVVGAGHGAVMSGEGTGQTGAFVPLVKLHRA